MPKPRRRFLQLNSNENTNMTATPQTLITPKLQRCFVCYNQFTPFVLTSDKWESNMIKMFYSALNLPSPDDGVDEDDDDPIISLPFCPQCHSKTSVMASLHGQLQLIQAQFSAIRNDVVFTIVETNEQNCRKGPMDFIRQQIYDKWKDRYEEAKTRSYLDNPIGLESIANESGVKKASDDFLYPNSEDNNLVQEFANSLGDAVSPFGGVYERERLANLGQNNESNRMRAGIQNPGSVPRQLLPSKRPVRSARAANFLSYNDSPGMAKFREMETIAKSMGGPPMPRLIPMGMHGKRPQNMGPGQFKNFGQQRRPIMNQNPTFQRRPLEHQLMTATNQVGQGGSPIKRVNPVPVEAHGIPTKLARMRPGSKRQIQLPARLSFPSPRRGRPDGWRKQPPSAEETEEFEGTSEERDASSLDDSTISVDDHGDADSNNLISYACRICPKLYYSASRLRRHESLCHPSTKALQCSLCANGFSSMLAFRRHMQHQHHQPLDINASVTCAICSKVFEKQSTFDTHLATHEKLHWDGPPQPSVKSAETRVVSGTMSVKKPGPKPREARRSLSITTELEFKSELKEPKIEENADFPGSEEATESTFVETEETNPNAIVTTKPHKKKTYFMGGRKRRRRRVPKVEGEEAAKKEKQPEAESRVPRKKIQHVEPVRKSLRRAESAASTPVIKASNSEGNGSAESALANEKLQNADAEESITKNLTPESEEATDGNGESETVAPNEPNSKGAIVIKSNDSKEKVNEVDDAKPVVNDLQVKGNGKAKAQLPPIKTKKVTRNSSKEPRSVLATSPKGRLICPICELEYPFLGLLQMHLQSHWLQYRDETKCEDCDKQFDNDEGYRQHVVAEHKRELMLCPICDEDFGSKNYYNAHQVKHKYEKSKNKPEGPVTIKTKAGGRATNSTAGSPKSENNKINLRNQREIASNNLVSSKQSASKNIHASEANEELSAEKISANSTELGNEKSDMLESSMDAGPVTTKASNIEAKEKEPAVVNGSKSSENNND